jgi:hypothetical protein
MVQAHENIMKNVNYTLTFILAEIFNERQTEIEMWFLVSPY